MDNENNQISNARGLNWNQFLHRIAHEAPPKTNIRYQGTTYNHPTVNELALGQIAHLSFTKATDHLSKTLLPEDGYDLFYHKNTLADSYEEYHKEITASDPYILFCYLPLELKKNVLAHLELTSGTAQNKFLGMTVCRAFSYYAVCRENCALFPSFDLYFSLDTRKQVRCMAAILGNKKNEIKEAELTWLPKGVLEEPEYTAIMNKKITVFKEKICSRRGDIAIPEKMTIKEACTKPKEQSSIAPVFSPTILSKAVARFPSTGYIWLLSHHD